MRVVHVSCFRDQGDRDAETLLHEWGTLTGVAAGVRRAGGEVTVVQAAAADARVEREGVPFHFVREARPPGATLIFARAAPLPFRSARVIAGCRPEVIHFHGLSFPLQTMLLARRFPGVRLLLQDHADAPLAGWRGRAQRRALRSATTVAFTACEQAAPFRRAGVLGDAARVREVCEGSSAFTPGDRAEARARTGMTGDPAVLCVGDLSEGKDPLTTLALIALAGETLTGLQLWWIYRSAPLLDAVRARIAGDPLLADRVHLVGPVDPTQMEAWYRGADYFVSASRREGSGYAAIEALACGTPAILSDIPSFRRIADDGRAGALFPMGDALAGARALVDLERGDRGELRRRARARFEAELSFDAIGHRLVALYQEALSA